jgi:hypothetical protein
MRELRASSIREASSGLVLGCIVTTLMGSAAYCEPAAQPGATTSEATMKAVLARHVVAVKSADIEGELADYAEDATLVSPPGLVTPTGTFVGKTKVRDFFVWLSSAEVLPAAQSMTATTELVGPNTMLFRWTQFPGTPKQVIGSDVFIFRSGKIIFQTTAPLP